MKFLHKTHLGKKNHITNKDFKEIILNFSVFFPVVGLSFFYQFFLQASLLWIYGCYVLPRDIRGWRDTWLRATLTLIFRMAAMSHKCHLCLISMKKWLPFCRIGFQVSDIGSLRVSCLRSSLKLLKRFSTKLSPIHPCV